MDSSDFLALTYCQSQPTKVREEYFCYTVKPHFTATPLIRPPHY